MDCSHYYLIEQNIREALRSKANKKEAPEDFILQIREKIKDLDK